MINPHLAHVNTSSVTKVSDLIAKLQSLVELHGDLDVNGCQYRYYGPDNIQIWTLGLHEPVVIDNTIIVPTTFSSTMESSTGE